MAMKKPDPREQFSKKLAKWSSWFWFIYMIMLLAVLAYQPLSAEAIIWLAGITSFVMICNIWAYTDNSIYDKAIAAGVKIVGKFRFTGRKNKSSASDDDEEEYEDEGEGGNG